MSYKNAVWQLSNQIQDNETGRRLEAESMLLAQAIIESCEEVENVKFKQLDAPEYLVARRQAVYMQISDEDWAALILDGNGVPSISKIITKGEPYTKNGHPPVKSVSEHAIKSLVGREMIKVTLIQARIFSKKG